MQLSFSKSQGPVSFHGQARLKVVEGKISLFGRTLSDTDGPFDIFSPRCNALLSVEAVTDTAVVEFSSLSQNGLLKVDTVQPQFGNLFVSSSSDSNVQEVVPGLVIVKNFGSYEIFHPLVVSDTWQEAAASLTSATMPVILVCGQRKVGKSTFSRFITNSLLNEHDSVDFVDLDPGQTEFTTAGFVVRKQVQRPGLFGPPFTHLSLPDDSIFLASASPSEVAGLYCRAIAELSKGLLQERVRPVVVNTIGWMTGLGFEFLQFAARCFRPTHLFCFSDPECTDEGHDSVLSGLMRPSELRCIESEPFSPEEAGAIQLRYMNASLGDLPKAKFHPADWRNLAYWCYFFGKCSSSNWTIDSFSFSALSQLKPVAVPLRKLQLATSSKEIDLFELLGQGRLARLRSLLLMRLVGLVVDSSFTPTKPLNLLPRHDSNRIATMKALGVGIIRSIHPFKRKEDGMYDFLLQVITPLPIHLARKSNTLLFGSVSLPSQLVANDQQSIQVEAPFLPAQNHADSVGSGVRSNRSNVLRRRE